MRIPRLQIYMQEALIVSILFNTRVANNSLIKSFKLNAKHFILNNIFTEAEKEVEMLFLAIETSKFIIVFFLS